MRSPGAGPVADRLQRVRFGALSVRAEGDAGETIGFVEIDEIVAGRCCGGLQMAPTFLPGELSRVARVGTLKNGYVGLPAGGAAPGVVLPAGAAPDERTRRLEAFGRTIAPLLKEGILSIGQGLGSRPEDVALVRRGAGLATWDLQDNARWTGLSVSLAAVAALRACGIEPRGARAAVQGVGAVGSAAIRYLLREGVRVVAAADSRGTLVEESGIDLEVSCESARGLMASRDRLRPSSDLTNVPCDVLIPCASTGLIDVPAARALSASTVVCGANDPFAEGAEEILLARRVLVVPDFVANGGGRLGSTLQSACGADAEEIEEVLRRRLMPQIAATIAGAARSGEPVGVFGARQAVAFLDRCALAYADRTAASLLPEALGRKRAWMGPLLAVERRTRGSRKLSFLNRILHPVALRHAERTLWPDGARPGRLGGFAGRGGFAQ